MTDKVLCIYHANCQDGFAAAWAVRHALGEENVEFYPGVYQNDPPDVEDRAVLLVDFSYKRPVIDAMSTTARSIMILDHHKSAQEGLRGLLDVPPTWSDWILACRSSEHPRIAALFDMARSGAGMAWDFFHPGQPRPTLIDLIEDRDLWRFKYPSTRPVSACVFSYPYDFDVWDVLLESSIASLWREGEAIERKHHKDIAELVGVTKRRMKIGGYDVPVANLPYTLTSDAGNLMAQGEPFAACYWDTPEGRVFSLRSTDDGLDVSAIAKSYGGGGHRNASGFRMSIGWEGE